MTKKSERFIFVFASNYHGYYIEDLLSRHNVENSLRKAPRAIGRSCNTAIYINEHDYEKAIKLMNQAKVKPQEVYEVMWEGSLATYKKIKGKE